MVRPGQSLRRNRRTLDADALRRLSPFSLEPQAAAALDVAPLAASATAAVAAPVPSCTEMPTVSASAFATQLDGLVFSVCILLVVAPGRQHDARLFNGRVVS